MKRTITLALPLVTMLVACGGAPSITATEAAKVMSDINAAQSTEAVQNAYKDMKVIAKTTGSEDTTFVYSPANEYYRVETASNYAGVYRIDGVLTGVAVTDGQYATTTDTTEIASVITAIESGVQTFITSAVQTASVLILTAQAMEAYASNLPSEAQGMTVTLTSSGAGNLTTEVAQGSNKTSVSFNNNLPVSVYSRTVDSSADVTAEVTFSYGTSSGDRSIRTAA